MNYGLWIMDYGFWILDFGKGAIPYRGSTFFYDIIKKTRHRVQT